MKFDNTESRFNKITCFTDSDGDVRLFPCDGATSAEVIAEFARHGYKVSELALEHNYNAWKHDFKSAFVENVVEVFTPCGCNPLSFTASKATEQSRTYIA